MGISAQALRREIELEYAATKIRKAASAPRLGAPPLFTLSHGAFADRCRSQAGLLAEARGASQASSGASPWPLDR